MKYLDKRRKRKEEKELKNQKISSDNLYIAQLVVLELQKTEFLPDNLVKQQLAPKVFNPAIYTIVRRERYWRPAVDVYDNSEYLVVEEQCDLSSSVYALLEKPIKCHEKEIGYKDLDAILEEYKSNVKTKK